MRLGLGASVMVSFVLWSSPSVHATGDAVGLTRDDWTQLRRAVQSTFVHEAQLTGHGDPNGQADANFGYAVAVSGDTAVVGAPFEDTSGGGDAGAAYVFVRFGTTWVQQRRLVAADGAASDFFGWSVSLSGNTAVVGAYQDDTTFGADAGSAYVFVRSGVDWSLQQQLLPTSGASTEYFGHSVSLDGDTVIVGSPLADAAGGTVMDAGAAVIFVRSGTTWTQQQRIEASDPAASDDFGYSVSLSGETAAVGSPFDNTPGFETGSAYVFVRSGTTWSEQEKLVPPDGLDADQFGAALSVSGDTVAIGALGDDDPGAGPAAGSTYVFVRSGMTWSQQQKLLADDADANDLFGYSVSLSGDTVAIGASGDDTAAGVDSGSAYVFVRSGTTWSQQQQLLASDGAANDALGYSAAVDGDTVVVGAISDDISGVLNAGSAYAFVRSGGTWTEQQRLGAMDSAAGDEFGFSVSVSGDTAVVGAYRDDAIFGPSVGAAYVFVRSGTTWTQQQKLRASDAAPGDRFGESVSLSGDTIVAGATGAAPVGSAYVFVRSGTTWTEQQKLLASDGAPGDNYGFSVSVSGETAVVGAFGANTQLGADAGAAYVFVRSGGAWTQQQKLLLIAGAAFDRFGFAVALEGDTVIIGATGSEAGGGSINDAGAAVVFVRSGTTWSEQQKITASDAATDDNFGYAVTLSGETAVVGVPFDDTSGIDEGSAYVFLRSGTTWSEQQKLLASDGADNDRLGTSLSVFGDTVAIGAPDYTGGGVTGSAYIFVRTGTSWSEQQKLVAPTGAAMDLFGTSVSLSGDTVVIGAPLDDAAGGADAGSAHVFRGLPEADLGANITDGQGTAVPGEPLTYTISAGNGGPDAVTGATVTDLLPPELLGATWTCSGSPGSSCTPGGSGSINDTVNLPAFGFVAYTLTATVASGAVGTLTNTVTITAPAGVTDPDPSNNTASDTDTLSPRADLGISKTDSADPVSPGDPLTYLLTAANAGPSDATLVTVTDTLPSGVTFVSSLPPPPTCILAGSTLTCTLGSLAAGANATVTIDVTVNPGAAGVLGNVAGVAGNEPDPDPADNTATEVTTVLGNQGELTHGMNIVHDLAADPGPAADVDVFLMSQKPFSSYEVVVDATSGDIGGGTALIVERIHPNGAQILQESSPIGTGSSRTLRWANTTSGVIEGQVIRVRSGQCGTDCGTDDVYRIRAYETTYAVPRFNNSGTQITVLVLQNPTNYPISGEIYFLVPSGMQVGMEPFTLAPKATIVLNTATVPGAAGVSGAMTVAHDGRYGDLSGKTVALEPATGFSFDSALEPRPK
jgi:uncharacterized repeat protein (TIGR01451 family)